MTNRQKRIAAIHDLSGAGKCSLTVALPIISAAGVECSCIPTAILSTHTGEFTGYALRDLTDMLLPIARHWKSEGIEFDGIYSGYLSSPLQADVLSEIIDMLASKPAAAPTENAADTPASTTTKIIIDPVMADNGVFYAQLDGGMIAAFRRLCAGADLITPNITEAALLGGMPYLPPPHDEAYVSALMSALLDLGAKAAAITGIQPDREAVANAIQTAGGELTYETRPLQAGVFYGTGDIFASAMSALLVRGADEYAAIKIATELVDSSVKKTISRGTPRRFGVDFESALPGFIAAVEKSGIPQ